MGSQRALKPKRQGLVINIAIILILYFLVTTFISVFQDVCIGSLCLASKPYLDTLTNVVPYEEVTPPPSSNQVYQSHSQTFTPKVSSVLDTQSNLYQSSATQASQPSNIEPVEEQTLAGPTYSSQDEETQYSEPQIPDQQPKQVSSVQTSQLINVIPGSSAYIFTGNNNATSVIRIPPIWTPKNCSICIDRHARLHPKFAPIPLFMGLCPDSPTQIGQFGKKMRLIAPVQFERSPYEAPLPFTSCSIPKVGSSQWERVKAKIQGYNHVLTQDSVFKGTSHLEQLCNVDRQAQRRLYNDPHIPRVLFVRNPYARLVSGYLDKVVHEKMADVRDIISAVIRKMPVVRLGIQFQSQLRPLFPRLFALHNQTTLLEYVTLLRDVKAVLGPMIKSNYFDHHFTLQSLDCGIPLGATFDMVLKVERINDWYLDFIDQLQLHEQMATGWPEEGNCFLSTVQRPCNGPQAVVDAHGGVSFTETQEVLEMEGRRHSYNGTGGVQSLITPEVAAIVNELYHYDFVVFNYTKWDGKDIKDLKLN